MHRLTCLACSFRPGTLQRKPDERQVNPVGGQIRRIPEGRKLSQGLTASALHLTEGFFSRVIPIEPSLASLTLNWGRSYHLACAPVKRSNAAAILREKPKVELRDEVMILPGRHSSMVLIPARGAT
jgi:hypothetical protein